MINITIRFPLKTSAYPVQHTKFIGPFKTIQLACGIFVSLLKKSVWDRLRNTFKRLSETETSKSSSVCAWDAGLGVLQGMSEERVEIGKSSFGKG